MPKLILNGIEYANNKPDGYPPLIYSDEEREVGVWRDGKPLYQKSILFTAVSEGNTIPVDSNIDTFMFVPNATFTKQANSGNVVNYGFYEASNNKCQMYYERTSNSIQVRPISSSLVGPSVVTFQYTKTTDTPGSGKYTTYGGLAYHYSTTEQVVGTWVDGKPLYQKTIDCGALHNTISDIAHGISNLKRIVFFEGNAISDGGVFLPIPLVQFGSNVTDSQIRVGADSTNIRLWTTSATDIASVIVTLKYTKTTD